MKIYSAKYLSDEIKLKSLYQGLLEELGGSTSGPMQILGHIILLEFRLGFYVVLFWNWEGKAFGLEC